MALSEKDTNQLSEEILDPRKVVMGCPTHEYYGPSNEASLPGIKLVDGKMNVSCKTCWMVHYLCVMKNTPPSERAEKIETLTRAVRNLNQAYESGKWDYQPLARPEITYE